MSNKPKSDIRKSNKDTKITNNDFRIPISESRIPTDSRFPNPEFRSKRITITGGKGFLGTHLIRKLTEQGYTTLSIADLPDYNLIDIHGIRRMYEDQQPEIVIHLAAKVGGIGFNQENPASLFYENAIMGIQLMHEAYLRGIEKFVALGTICAYPKVTPVPFQEDDLWNGYPEETNAPYGLAKKMMLVQSQAYRQQYGFNSIFLLPVNLYGPGDNFSFTSSHVIPALIRKFHLANLLLQGDFTGIIHDFLRNKDGVMELGDKRLAINPDTPQDEVLEVLNHCGISDSRFLNPEPRTLNPGRPPKVVVWGTGTATREFFYVEDAAEAIILAMERYNKSDPVNIGAGFEISIKELVDRLVKITGFKDQIIWDSSKPDGQPRRMLDTTKALSEFGFRAKTNFETGLRKTIEWYINHKDETDQTD
jgi:GDP-L-fucose synthase